MRIIAGELRGRKIDAPDGDGTRPMLDRVREAVFSTLGDRVDDALVLDLFAGSGSLSLECVSRGARHVRCLERAARALTTLKANVEHLGVKDRVRVIRGDALATKTWFEPDAPDVRYDLVFMDPPYPMIEAPVSRADVIRAVRDLFELALAPNGVVVLHLATRASEMMRYGAGVEYDVRVYGTSAIVYLTRAAPPTSA